jgi:hypothetical protein
MKWSEIVYMTPDECKAQILTWMDGIGFTGSSWGEGAIPSAFVWIGSRVFSKLTEVVYQLKLAHTLADAEDEALDAYADSQYDEERNGAVAAQYLLELTCEAGEGPHSLDVSDVIATDGDYTYRNIEGNSIVYPYNLAGGNSVYLLFEAEQPGADATVAAGTITELQTTFAGVTITDGILQTSGEDEESNDALKARCRTKWPTLSEGETISEHVVNICLNADTTIKRATVDDGNPRGDYTADVYLASDTGTVAGAAVTAAQTALDLRFFSPNTVLAIASAADALAITGTVYYDPSVTAGDAQDAVEAALVEFFKSIPVGGFMYGGGLDNVVTTDDVRDAVRSTEIDGARIVRTFAMTVPAANHTVADYDVVTQGALTLTYTAASF